VLELANLSAAYDQLGQDKALATAEEAVRLGRPLTDGSDEDRYRLAVALHRLSGIHFELRQFDQATTANAEALPIIRGLAKEESGYDSLLADALTVRSALLSANGRHNDGLTTLTEAVALRERLAEQEPDHHLPALVLDLHNLAQILSSDLGNHEQARIAAQRAVDLARRLASDNPAAHRGGLIHTLNQLTVVLLRLGQTTAAAQASEEAVGHGRHLAGTPRGDRLLAASLQHFADAARFAGDQPEEAIAAAEEAVALWRGLTEFSDDSPSPELAKAMQHLGHMYTQVGRDTDALPVSVEAVHLFRQLVDINPGHLPGLATALTHLAEVHVIDGEEALSIAQESIDCHRRLGRGLPGGFDRDFSLALASVSDRYAELGRWPEALDAIREATKLAGRQIGFESHRALILAKLADRYGRMGHYQEALSSVCKSVEIYEQLACEKSHRNEVDFAFAIKTLGRIHLWTGRYAKAASALELAIHHYDQLAKSHSNLYLPLLAASLNSLRTAYTGLGRFADALPISQRATDIYQDQARHHPDRYLSPLADSLDRLSYLFAMCGDLTSALAASRLHTTVIEQIKSDRRVDSPNAHTS
jgi:tetratricopeptide (TPR) repeat protein